MSCGNIIRNIVVDSLQNILYYILEEKCVQLGTNRDTHWRQSYRRVDLRNVSAGGGVSNGLPGGEVVSYWWAGDEPSGPAPSTAEVVLNPETTDSNTMTTCTGMDLSSSGSHLVLGTEAKRVLKSNVAVLSTSDGSRSTIPTDASLLSSLAFTPNRSRVYTVDESPMDFKLLSAAAVEGAGGIPLSGASVFEVVGSVVRNGNPKVGAMAFGPESFDPEGNCLYFVDADVDKVWGIDLLSASKTPTVIAGSGTGTPQDGDALMASFSGPTAVAVTADGCNLFVSQTNGLVRWVKLGSPCGVARSVQTVAAYSTAGLQGLALRANGTGLNVYVGSSDGHVFELEINPKLLHVCDLRPIPPIIPSPYSSSPPPPPNTTVDTDIASLSSVDTSHPPAAASISLPASESLPPVTPPPSQSVPLPLPVKASTPDPVVLLVAPILSALIAALIACAVVCYVRSRCAATRPPRQPSVECKSIEVPINGGRLGPEPATTSGSGSERQSISTPAELSWHEIQLASLTAFTHAQLHQCTAGFHPDNCIGEAGAFGNVYRGRIGDGQVAVKVMRGDATPMKRKQFAAEVNCLSRVHHTNLIRLLGYCHEGGSPMLVYPYFEGGSLYSRLHDPVGKAEKPPLTLLQRISIALDIAEGLRYLHHEACQPIIHRDVKSRNVLLSAGVGRNVSAVLADFGLATIVQKVFAKPEDAVVTTLHLAGTAGYIAPEYYSVLRLTVRTDVYAFGVIVLELLTGKKAVVHEGNASQHLVQWTGSMMEDRTIPLSMIVDECLEAAVTNSVQISETVRQAIDLAMRCSAQDDERRPTMTKALENVRDIHTQVQWLAPDQ
ncbi:hypothetical protein CBR_g55297 [Chara braunii]|uniref:Protein kinase domain-containing protein n=1 Tax=Chara braunii TaxID=69332 RepID=A0A388MCU7_CHABU|nr:hypothetical protein CBR_g55297 [Chara braunii]|eukprot:GBG92390.1 hypothetical protein CBR_g55297 [Chara braunii]